MGVSAPTLPPSVEEIKAWSRLDFESLDEPFTDEDIQVRINRTTAYLEQVTGRAMNDKLPRQLIPIAQEAFQLRIEQIARQEQEDYSDTAADDLIASFSAGSYSETRREPRSGTQPTTGLPEINPFPWLNRDIWLLCTEDMKYTWIEYLQGQAAASQIPSMETTEADWGNYDGVYPYDYGPGRWRPLPDPLVWGA